MAHMNAAANATQGGKRFNVLNGGAFFRPFGKFLKELPKDYIQTLSDVQSHHGDLVHWRLFGGLVNFAFVSDAETNRELFVRHADALHKLPSQVQTFLYAAGPSLATAHGDDWRKKRKEGNSLFSRQIVEASCAGQVSVVSDFVRTLESGAQDGMTVARRLAALTSSRGILGRQISLPEADAQIAFSQAAADRFNTEAAHMFARPHWMLAPWRRDLTRRKKEVFPIVQKSIDQLRGSTTPNDGLMNHYVNGDFVTSNDDEMLTIMVGLLMGAQDNVASAAGWVLAYLAHHGALQDQIKAEIETTGSDADSLQGCILLQATIAEILRLRPPAPANQPRVLKKPVEIADHTLPKGTYVFNSFYNMHHNPSVFADSESFDPTRFTGAGQIRTIGFAPFGHGPRNCVAQGMANQQLAAIVYGLLKRHKIAAQQSTFPKTEQRPFLVPAAFEIVVKPDGTRV